MSANATQSIQVYSWQKKRDETIIQKIQLLKALEMMQLKFMGMAPHLPLTFRLCLVCKGKSIIFLPLESTVLSK